VQEAAVPAARAVAADLGLDERDPQVLVALSIDDFVITYFNAGTTTTFPLFVWGAARVSVPPQINVVGTAIFLIAIGGMLANVLWQNRRARRLV